MNHYIKLAVRNILKQKTGSLINIFGLSISLAVCLIITLFVVTEFSYDKFNPNYDRIYRLLNVKENSRNPIHPVVFNEVLGANIPELSQGTMVHMDLTSPDYFRYNQQDYVVKRVAFTNPSFFDVFAVDFIEGDRNSALNAPNKLVITESTAKRIFGSENPVGKLVNYANSYDYEISGIIRDFPEKSNLHVDMLASYESMKVLNPFQMESWNNSTTQFYYMLASQTNIPNLEQKILSEYKKARPNDKSGDTFKLQPMSGIHLYSSDVTWDYTDKGSIQEVRSFIIIALLILIIACFNYINLSTALAGKRTVYTGIQKVMGADRGNIFISTGTEILLLMLVCSGLAFVISAFVLPGFNSIMGAGLSLADVNWIILLIFFAILVGMILVTSVYQSWKLSGVSPASILSGNVTKAIIRGKNSFSRFSQTLSVLQLGITMILVVSVITVFKQTSLVMEEKLGFNKEQMIVVENPWDDNMHKRYELLKKELVKMPEVKGVGASWNCPGESIGNNGPVELAGMGKESRVMFGQLAVDEGYLEVVEAKILMGRNFDRTLTSDSNKVIINKMGMEMLNLKDPLGQRVKNLFTGGTEDYEIIGVVDNIQYQSLRETGVPVIYYLTQGLNPVVIRLNPGDMQAHLKKLEQVWKSIAPEYPFYYRFADQIIQSNYTQEIRTRSLLSVMAFLAIAISMLGIFGLGVFMAQRRIKEIGIRKVNGAKISEMVLLLNKDFVKWVTLAFIIATPVAWLVMHKWLEGFAYKTSLSWWIFVLAGLLAMTVALLTVTWQSWRAATRNPVESLRYE